MLHIDSQKLEKNTSYDTGKGQYLTSKVYSPFSLKSNFIITTGAIEEKLPIKNDEESFLVAEGRKISNLELFEDIFRILEIIDSVSSVY